MIASGPEALRILLTRRDGESIGQLGDGTTQWRNAPRAISEANYAWKVGTPVLSVASGIYSSDVITMVTGATPGSGIH